MRRDVWPNTINLCVGPTPYEILGPNPKRRAFILSPIAGGSWNMPGYISLSHRQDVIPGVGILNYITGFTEPTIISDEQIGNAVGLPWWIVSTYAVKVQVTEYSYADMAECEGR